MSLANILAAIQGDVAAHLNPAPSFFTGARHLANRRLPPSVVWVPTRDDYGPPSKRTPDGQDPRATGRPLRTRRVGVQAHCWAADLASAEALVHAVVAAAYRVAYGAFEVSGGDWSQTEYLEQGEACTVDFTFLVPVTDDVAQLVQPTSIGDDPTGAASGDGVLSTGDP